MAESKNFVGSTAAIAVTAAVFSPQLRGMLHSGAVRGLAGVLIAGDAVSSFARGLSLGLRAEQARGQSTLSATEAEPEAARDSATAPEAAGAARDGTANTGVPSRVRKTAKKPKQGGEPGGGAS